MNKNITLDGKLLISKPSLQDHMFAKTVILVARHTKSLGAWGVIVNKLSENINIQTVMKSVGIEYTGTDRVFLGGPVEPNRVQIVHTLDWSSNTTLKITDDLGITGDVSILSAISANQGPKSFRIGVGLVSWIPGQLEGEQSGKNPWTPNHQWLTTDPSVDLCLRSYGEDTWNDALNLSIKDAVSSFF